MERVTITIEPELLKGLDSLMEARGYSSRSEAVRDILRDALQSESTARNEDGQCVAALTYVYDHHKRQLSNRLTDLHHDHHDLTISTMHVHLNHDSCLEVAILRGSVKYVRALSENVTTQSGVRHGHTHYVPADIAMHTHEHGHGHGHHHTHGHKHEHIQTLVWNPKED